MKKLISVTVMALLVGVVTAGLVMASAQSGDSPSSPSEAAGKMGRPGAPDMGMMGMGQAMMPSMMNMMLAESPMPVGSAGAGGKMMNMPMMGASMMPMGMGGMGMMPLMMGGSSEETAASLEKYRGFLKETYDARKKLHDLAFIYFEARWTPETTVQQLQDTALKMRQLRDEIMSKMPK